MSILHGVQSLTITHLAPYPMTTQPTMTNLTPPTRITLPAKDGYPLAAHRFDPPNMPAKGVILIAPAMAVVQAFYAPFAHFLASQGYRVWTFDYRGTGASLTGSMRGAQANLSDWISKDYDAILCHANEQDAALPIFAIGHSFGGQVAPLLPSRERLQGVITIASGSGAMRHNTPNTRRAALLLWYLLAPLLCPLFGYFPGAKIGVIGNVPSGALMQWRRWCLTPDYLLTGEQGAREAYASASYAVLGLAFTDDELLLEQGVRFLHQAYQQSQPDFRVLQAQQFGLQRIGHFGFFKAQHAEALWPMIPQWLAQQS